jgi:hypothetical protein
MKTIYWLMDSRATKSSAMLSTLATHKIINPSLVSILTTESNPSQNNVKPIVKTSSMHSLLRPSINFNDFSSYIKVVLVNQV